MWTSPRHPTVGSQNYRSGYLVLVRKDIHENVVKIMKIYLPISNENAITALHKHKFSILLQLDYIFWTKLQPFTVYFPEFHIHNFAWVRLCLFACEDIVFLDFSNLHVCDIWALTTGPSVRSATANAWGTWPKVLTHIYKPKAYKQSEIRRLAWRDFGWALGVTFQIV